MSTADTTSLLRLLQLVSPSLPVGAFAYSQGLEYAVEAGWIHDETSARQWLQTVLDHGLARLDIPVAWRLYQAWSEDNETTVKAWDSFLWASRESRQLQEQETHLAVAMSRILAELEVPLTSYTPRCFASWYTLAAVYWHIPAGQALQGLLWSWLENMTLAAVKLVPLGQTAGQRILSQSMDAIGIAVHNAQTMHDDDIGALLPGATMAAMLHETLYSRLFRS